MKVKTLVWLGLAACLVVGYLQEERGMLGGVQPMEAHK